MSGIKKRGSNILRRLSSFYATPKSLVNKRLSHELVPNVRESVLEIYENDNQLFDECDVNRLKSDEWFVQRFIEYYGNDVEEATEHLVSNMMWRKVFGLNSRQIETDCPKEFFNIGALVPYNEDKDGINLVYLRVKCNRKVSRLQPFIEMFVVAILENVDKEVGNRGFGVVMDCSNTGLSNVTIDLLQFVIHVLKDRYPLSMQYVLVYNLPWIMKGVWSLAKGFLGEYQKYVKFAKNEEIFDYIDVDLLPKFLGGNCEKSFTKAPDNCPTVYELADKYGFTQKEVTKYMKVYEDLLKEAETIG